MPGAGVAVRDLEAHRARHALQQGTEQLARRPDRHPCRCQCRRSPASDEEAKAQAVEKVHVSWQLWNCAF